MNQTGKQVGFFYYIKILMLNKFFFQRHTRYNDQAFHDMLRRRMEYDRQRSGSYSNYSPAQKYFAPASIMLIIIGLGMFLHALQWR